MKNTFPVLMPSSALNFSHPFYTMVTLCLHNALIFNEIAPFGSQRWDDFRQLVQNPFGIKCLEIDISVGAGGENVISHRDQLLMGFLPNPVSGALSLDAMVPWVHAILRAGQFSAS